MATDRVLLEAALVRESVLLRRVARQDDDIARLGGVVEHLRSENRDLHAQLADYDETKARLAALEARLLALTKDSTTSAKPPSGDGPQRRYPTRPRSTRASGGQPGHGPTALQPVEPDEIIEHEPAHCACSADLAGADEGIPVIRQVWDVRVHRHVVEHRAMRRRCECGRTTTAEFPAGVTARIVWGPGIKAAAVAASAAGRIPARCAALLVEAAYGHSPSAATIEAWQTDLAGNLDGFDAACAQILRDASVIGADETPLRVFGVANAHAHVAVTEQITRLHLADRTNAGITTGGVVGTNTGVLVTDCLAGYWSLHPGAHQACVQHLMRECRFFDQAFAPDEGTHPHPVFGELAAHFGAGIHTRNEAAVAGAGPPGSQAWRARARELCADGLAQLADIGKTEHDARNLLARLDRLNDNEELWRFLDDLDVPPTNNASEQPFKVLEVRQRRSGCFRTAAGARVHLRITGYLDTARKLGVDPITALTSAFAGQPVIPEAAVVVAA